MNVYSNKLVINLYIITSYKLHIELSCVSSQSSSSCRVCRAKLFDKLDTAKMHGLDMSNVSSGVVSRSDEPSGIWAILTIAMSSYVPNCSSPIDVCSREFCGRLRNYTTSNNEHYKNVHWYQKKMNYIITV